MPQIKPYALPFKQHFKSAKLNLTHREGFILYLRSGEHIGCGEAAPLDGFSRENIAEATTFISKHRRYIQSALEFIEDVTSESWIEFLNSLAGPPSARFALDTAFHDLKAAILKEPLLKSCFKKQEHYSIKINTLIPLQKSAQDLQNTLEYNYDKGFRSFKLKVNTLNPSYLTTLKEFNTVHPDATFRFDPNSNWTLDTALEEFEKLAASDISVDYVEQPLIDMDFEFIQVLRKRFPTIAVAADEMITNQSIARKCVDSKLFKTIIVKPQIIGCYNDLFALAQYAVLNETDIVLTSFLESVVGRTATAALCTFTPSQYGNAHGLNTGHLLLKDTGEYPALDNKASWDYPDNSSFRLYNLLHPAFRLNHI